MTNRAAMQTGRLASDLLFASSELLADAEQRGQAIDPALCGDICAGLRDIAQHVLALEAYVRALDLLGEPDFRAAVTSLPLAERRALAQDALKRTDGSTVIRFRSRGRVR